VQSALVVVAGLCGRFFGNDDPADEIRDDPDTQRHAGDEDPDNPYDDGIDIEVYANTPAHPAEKPFGR